MSVYAVWSEARRRNTELVPRRPSSRAEMRSGAASCQEAPWKATTLKGTGHWVSSRTRTSYNKDCASFPLPVRLSLGNIHLTDRRPLPAIAMPAPLRLSRVLTLPAALSWHELPDIGSHSRKLVGLSKHVPL